MDDMKIVKSLEESDVLIKVVSETIKIELKKQQGEFLSIILGSVVASLLGNHLTGKGVKQSETLDCVAKTSNRIQANIPRRGVMRAGEGTSRIGQNV